MSFFDAVLFGLVQGLTEFLPVSSSGHLILLGRILGYAPSIALELTAHLGTLLAVVIVYRKTLWSLIRHPLQKSTLYLLVSTVATAAVVYIGKDFFFSLNDGRFLSLGFLLTAALLLVSPHLPRAKNFSLLGAAAVGLAQGLAAIPGLSRSGTVVSASKAAGHDDPSAYAFIVSIPVIVGSSIVSLTGGGIASCEILPALVTAVVAFLSGFLALKLFIALFQKGKTFGFAVYLILLSAFLIVNDLWLHII